VRDNRLGPQVKILADQFGNPVGGITLVPLVLIITETG
jgi:hypothetical protein